MQSARLRNEARTSSISSPASPQDATSRGGARELLDATVAAVLPETGLSMPRDSEVSAPGDQLDGGGGLFDGLSFA